MPYFRVMEVQAHRNGSHICVLDYTLGTCRSILEAWHLCEIQPQAE